MRSAPLLSVLCSCLAGLAAQQKVEAKPVMTRVFPCPNLEHYEVLAPAASEPTRDSDRPARRLERLLRRLLVDAAERPEFVLQLGHSPSRGEVVIARTDADSLATLRQVVEQVAKPAIVRTRLQCSLVTLPTTTATELCLQPGPATPIDDAAVVKLLREATRNKGTLQNVPEIMATPLSPFSVDVVARAAVDARPAMRVSGELVPVGDEEVAVAVELVRRLPKTDVLRAPTQEVMAAVFRLQPNQAALAIAVEGDRTTALIVRCIEVNREPVRGAQGR
ncbi:MAG: hypothetical protein MUC36_02190 [Planctomycetes bacterium]|jgi:hypothetical protein|nr:hypothetical protein [Planctomycetota bacterium]